MRYEDTSSAFQASGPVANDDQDTLAAGGRGPATGNLITGEGTQYGAAGADSAVGGHITAIGGQGGEDSSFAGGKLSVSGAYGQLSVDAEGNYSYLANKGAPENVRDRFTYTLADSAGNTDTGALIVEIGKTPAVIKANAQQIVPGPDGVVTLPPGVELSDIMVVGRNLVINMPDGTQLIIVDGAVFVPQLSLGGVDVPASNVAALLIGQEVQPAAGETPPSSGGNFALPPPPLDPGVPLGDLIPPTEYVYKPPEPQEVFPIEDREPTITIQPDGQPAAVNAIDSVDEKGLPTRNGGEPEGSGEEAAAGADGDTSEATAGTIIIDSPDGVASVMINGVLVTGAIGQQIAGDYGTLTIAGFDGDNILYSYLLNDNINHADAVPDHDDFSVTLTDSDGDQATATLEIDIIDDVPTARNDTDAVIKGDTSTDGNVMSGVGTTSGVAGHDTVGADDADLTGIHPGTSGSFTAVPGGGVSVDGTFGELTINPDGSYTYVLHADVGDGGNDVFTYQLTDGDGDTTTATLTITVPPDLKPIVGPNPTVIVDDDAFAGGNPGGTGDDPNAVNVSGQLSGSGGDSPLAFSVQLTGAPAGFTYVSGGAGVVLIQQGGITVVTVTVDSDGSYTVVQNAVIDHSAGGDENNQPFTINYTVTDVDGDSASGTLNISVDDDTPLAFNDSDTIASGSLGPAVGNVITGSGTNEGTGNADSPGADGFQAVVGLVSVNVPANSDNNPAGGFVVVGQYGTLTMQDDGSYSYARDPGSPGGVSDAFTYTYVDQDGDTVSAVLTIDIGNSVPDVPENVNVGLDDDALANGNPGGTGDDPDAVNTSGSVAAVGGDGTITYALSDTGAPGGFSYQLQGNGDLWILQGATHVLTVTLDQSGNYTVSQVAPIDHSAGGDENNTGFTVTFSATDVDNDSDSGTFTISVDDDTPVLSNVVAQGGVDVDESDAGSPAGFPVSDTSVLPLIDFDAAFGADGPASSNDTVFGLVITGGPGSGLQTAVGDFAITLVQIDGDTIEGHYNGSNVAFIIQMNGDGTVTLTQNVALEHLVDGPPGPAHNDTLNLAGLIAATVTITDGDGDSTSAQAGIGNNLVFFDDGPSANNDTDSVGAVGDTATGNVITGSGTNEGTGNADDPGADGFGSITQLVGFGGSTDSDPTGGFDVNGQYGTLEMNADGSYTYTRTGGPGGAQDVFTYTYQDQDGDTVSATLTITLGDSTPTAGNVNVGLDDDALANGNPGGVGDDPDSVNATGFLPGSGGDAPLAFGVLLTGAPAGFTYVSGGAGIVLVKQGATTVLTVTVNSTTGAYSVVQNAPIHHAAGSDENNQPFTINYTVTDSDTDVANGTISISVDDDTPTVTANSAVQLDDDALAGGNPGGSGDVNPDTANTSGTLAHSYGADGAGSVAYLTTGAPAGFSYALQGNGDLWVMQGAVHVITLTVNATTGAYTVTQVAPIDHAAGNAENDQAFTINYRVTDGDGDTVDGSIVVNVDDDTPTVAANAAVQLDDDALAGGIAGGTGDVNPDTANTSGTLAHSYGADGAGSTAYLTTGAPAGFSYVLQGNGDLWIMQGAVHVITLTVNATTGAYSVTQVHAIDHAAGNDENDQAFTVTYRVTDHDGDTADGTIVINVDDDTPTVSANAAVQLDDDALTGGNPGGTGDVNPDTANTSGTLGHAYGADGAGSTAYLTTGAPAGFSYALQGNGDLWVMQGAVHVITLTVNATTGAYTVTQVAPISHAAGSDENDQAFTINYRVTDHDGDTADGSIVINVDDDTPINFNPVDLTDTTNATASTLDDALVNDGTASATRFINDSNANPANGENFIGADGFGTLTFTATGHANGEQLENSIGDPLTSHGDPIFVFGYGTDTLTATTSSNNSDPSAVVFTVHLDENAGYGSNSTYTIDFNDTVDNGAGVTFDNLTSAKAGNVDVRAVGADDPGTPVDLLLTASFNGANATINTDADSIGAANQSMDQGETVRIDFVSNAVTNAGLPSGFGYSGHVGTQSLLQTIPQVQGSQTETVAFRVYALDTTVTQASSPDDTPVAGDPAFSDSSTVDIVSVTVDGFDVGETPVTVALLPAGQWTTVAYGVYAQLQTDGSVIFTGVQQGDQYGIETGSDFNAFAVTSLAAGIGPVGHVSSTNSFDLGIFAIGSVDTGDPVNLAFGVTATDADGDTSTGTIDVTLVPDTSSPFALPPDPQSSSQSLTTSSLLVSNDNTSSGERGHGNSGKNVGDTGIMAGIVAAAGLIADSAAAHPPVDGGHGQSSDLASDYVAPVVEQSSVSDNSDSPSVSLLSAEPQAEESAPASSRGNSDDHSNSGHGVDDSPAPAAADASDHGSSDEHSSAPAASDASPVAPAVAMVSAEALQAAAGVEGHGNSQHGVTVEQVVAEALGQGGAPTVDAALANLPGGAGQLAAIAKMASPAAEHVSGWDMGAHGASGAAHDMMLSMHAPGMHHDAVQPAVNG